MFAYPARPAALAPIVGLSILNILTFLPGVGFFVRALLWLAAWKYAYEVLANTARGRLDPPESRYVASTEFLAVKQFALTVIMIGMLMAVAALGKSGALTVLAALFLALALPAGIMTLAMTRSLTAALNPFTWIEIMRRIGIPYLVGALFLGMMLSGMGSVEYFLLPAAESSWYMGSVFYFIELYFLVAMFYLMGYMIYQYHDALGVQLSATRKPLPGRENAPDQAMLNAAQALVAAGDIDQAIANLKREINTRGATPQVHDHYRKLLHIKGDKHTLLEHGHEYAMILLRALEQPKKALRVVEDCFKLDSGFDLHNAQAITELAELAERYGNYKLALKLTSGFARKYPGNRHIAQNYFLSAKIMSDKLNQDEKALGVLRSLLKQFPDHELQPEIAQYAQMLEGIVAK